MCCPSSEKKHILKYTITIKGENKYYDWANGHNLIRTSSVSAVSLPGGIPFVHQMQIWSYSCQASGHCHATIMHAVTIGLAVQQHWQPQPSWMCYYVRTQLWCDTLRLLTQSFKFYYLLPSPLFPHQAVWHWMICNALSNSAKISSWTCQDTSAKASKCHSLALPSVTAVEVY